MVNKQFAKSYVTAECSWDFWQLHEIVIVLLMSQLCSSWDVIGDTVLRYGGHKPGGRTGASP